MNCRYTTTGQYTCAALNSIERFDNQPSIGDDYRPPSTNSQTYNVLPGVLYYDNTMSTPYTLTNPSDCINACNQMGGCKGIVLDTDYLNGKRIPNPKTFTCRLLSALDDTLMKTDSSNKTSIIKASNTNIPGFNKGNCNSGYYDKTNGRTKYWKCGEKCPGGKYLTDDVCNCACKRFMQVTNLDSKLNILFYYIIL